MTLGESWAGASSLLLRRGVGAPDLEAEVLLRFALGISRAQFFSTLGSDLAAAQRREIDLLVERRSAGEPLAYIRGSREFYGLELVVSPAVLVPRQETETLVDLVLELSRNGGWEVPRVADVGTGSGAIAVAVAANAPGAQLFAVDASRRALEVADANRRRHGVADRVHLLLGDMIAPLRGPIDLIVSNPPYIRSGDMEALPDAVRREPAMALDGGDDGLGPTFRLLREAAPLLSPGGALVVEIDPPRLPAIAAYARSSFPVALIESRNDLLGLPRAVVVRLPR